MSVESNSVTSISPNSGESRSEYAYSMLRTRLVTLAIPPGEPFSEGQLAAELQISKTPVREALTRLQHEGLVEVEPRAGYRATPVTVGSARDLLNLRILLEGEAAALAAMRMASGTANAEIVSMVANLAKLSYDPDDRASIWSYLETNTQFHIGIAQIGGNQYLVDALARVFVLCERLLHVGMALTTRQRDVLHDHEDILASIASGNVDEARATAARQAELGRNLIVDALLSSSSVLTTSIEIPRLPVRT